MNRFLKVEFEGAYFNKFLRSSPIVSSDKLKRITKEKLLQVTVAGIAVPSSIENLHLLIAGATGSGKSVVMRELIYKALLRSNRMIIADPDGYMLYKFYQKGDKILNPYDIRSKD